LCKALLPTVYEKARDKYGMEESRPIIRFVCRKDGEKVETVSIWDNNELGYPISCRKY
jgi:hypothetical protein